MTLVRALIALGGLALAGVILWAAFALHDPHGGFLDQARAIVTLPWGVATLADLVLGFALFATLVFLTERSWVVAALWAAPRADIWQYLGGAVVRDPLAASVQAIDEARLARLLN